MMKRVVLLAIFIAGVIFSASAKAKTAKLSFRVANTSKEKVEVLIGDKKYEQVFNDKGEIDFDIEVKKECIGTIDYGNHTKDFYIRPGLKLNIKFDIKKDYGNWEIDCNDNGENNLLINYYVLHGLLVNMEFDLEDFLETEKAETLKIYKTALEGKKFSKYFRKQILNYQHMVFYGAINMFPFIHKYMVEDVLQIDEVAVPKNVYDKLKEKCIVMEEFSNSSLLKSYMSILIEKITGEEAISEEDHAVRYINYCFKLENKKLGKYLIYSYGLNYLGDKGYDKAKNIIENVRGTLKGSPYLEKFNIVVNNLNKLVKGKQSPSFNFMDDKGNRVKLEDLRGSYVYIDCWATWCGPCKAQIPHLKKLEEKYHNSNIKFVSISSDKDSKKWKDFVKKNSLTGIQLIAGRGSKFFKDYKINGIPRFILIDKEGKIIDANAPRPSEPKLIKILDSLK